MMGDFFLWSIFLAGIIARSNAQGGIGNNEVLIASKVEIKVNSVVKENNRLEYCNTDRNSYDHHSFVLVIIHDRDQQE